MRQQNVSAAILLSLALISFFRQSGSDDAFKLPLYALFMPFASVVSQRIKRSLGADVIADSSSQVCFTWRLPTQKRAHSLTLNSDCPLYIRQSLLISTAARSLFKCPRRGAFRRRDEITARNVIDRNLPAYGCPRPVLCFPQWRRCACESKCRSTCRSRGRLRHVGASVG